MKKTLLILSLAMAAVGCSDGQTTSRVRSVRDVVCGPVRAVVDRVCQATELPE